MCRELISLYAARFSDAASVAGFSDFEAEDIYFHRHGRPNLLRDALPRILKMFASV